MYSKRDNTCTHGNILLYTNKHAYVPENMGQHKTMAISNLKQGTHALDSNIYLLGLYKVSKIVDLWAMEKGNGE